MSLPKIITHRSGLIMALLAMAFFQLNAAHAQDNTATVPHGAHYVLAGQADQPNTPFVRFHASEHEVEFMAPGSDVVEQAGIAVRGDKLLVIGRKAYFEVKGDGLVMFFEGQDHRFARAGK